VFTAYNARYPQPQQPGVISLNTSAVPGNVNGSDNNLYSAAEIPGVATVVSGEGACSEQRRRCSEMQTQPPQRLPTNPPVPWSVAGDIANAQHLCCRGC
jgi:hypothetical protein